MVMLVVIAMVALVVMTGMDRGTFYSVWIIGGFILHAGGDHLPVDFQFCELLEESGHTNELLHHSV